MPIIAALHLWQNKHRHNCF